MAESDAQGKGLVGILQERIAAERRRIVVIGDAMVDVWCVGRLEDCQDGCEKFAEVSSRATDGGAANAYNCLRHWGLSQDLFSQDGAHRCIKTRLLDSSGKIIFRYDQDKECNPSYYKWAYSNALEMVGCAGGVLLSDYDKGFLTEGFIREVSNLCQRRGIPCVADCKRPPEVYEGCILKGNIEWWLKYHATAPLKKMVTTSGQAVPVADGFMVEAPYSAVQCVNHVGAGDCFAAHLTLALTYGFSLKEAAAISHSAGRVYVQHPYNRAPYPAEIAEDMAKATTPAEVSSAGVEELNKLMGV